MKQLSSQKKKSKENLLVVASENKKSYSTGEQEIAGEILAKNRNKKTYT